MEEGFNLCILISISFQFLLPTSGILNKSNELVSYSARGTAVCSVINCGQGACKASNASFLGFDMRAVLLSDKHRRILKWQRISTSTTTATSNGGSFPSYTIGFLELFVPTHLPLRRRLRESIDLTFLPCFKHRSAHKLKCSWNFPSFAMQVIAVTNLTWL
ncbi:hypothetical protein SDJN03_12882, partial [Cucurbita argyrosperma subsp. sororia]